MKDKRIWIVIGCILVIGTGVTYYTNAYVRSQAAEDQIIAQSRADLLALEGTRAPGAVSPGEGVAAAGSPAAAVAAQNGVTAGAAGEPESLEGALQDAAPGIARTPSEEGALQAADMAGAVEENALGQETTAETAGAAVAEVLEEGPAAEGAKTRTMEEAPSAPISPLAGVRDDKAVLITDYTQRLMDLDNQIQKMREEDGLETSSNVYSIKTSAETELKLWESELGAIYNALLELLPQEEAQALAAQQQEWLKSRDLKAVESTARNNSSVEGLGYAATLVSLTRDRAYELAGRYEEVNGITSESGADAAAAP